MLSVAPRASVPLNYKTRICVRFESEAGCPFGEKCHFAHGNAELRDVRANMALQNAPMPMDRQQPGSQNMGLTTRVPFQGLNAVGGHTSFLFARRDLTLPAPVLEAPPLSEDSILARVRQACTIESAEEWKTEGGSDIYGDNVKDMVI